MFNAETQKQIEVVTEAWKDNNKGPAVWLFIDYLKELETLATLLEKEDAAEVEAWKETIYSPRAYLTWGERLRKIDR